MEKCGCKVYETPWGDKEIIFCPLHAVAGEMLEALKEARLVLRGPILERFKKEVFEEALKFVRQAIAKTETREG